MGRIRRRPRQRLLAWSTSTPASWLLRWALHHVLIVSLQQGCGLTPKKLLLGLQGWSAAVGAHPCSYPLENGMQMCSIRLQIFLSQSTDKGALCRDAWVLHCSI